MTKNLLHWFKFTTNDDSAQYEPFMLCIRCSQTLCSIEEDDALDTIVGVAEDHIKERALFS